MRRMLAAFPCVLSMIFIYCATAYGGADTIVARVWDFPPQYYKDASGNLTGIDVELGRALVEAAGQRIEFVERPWSRALNDMKYGGLDLMMNLSITPERAEYMYFIGPERITRMVLIVKQGDENLPIQNMDDLAMVSEKEGKKIGIQQDAVYSGEFNERLNDPGFAGHFDSIADANLHPRKVAEGRILGFFELENTASYQLKHNPFYNGLALHPFVLQEDKVYFGVSKKVSPYILERLRQAYERLEKDGTFDKIRNKVWD